jgi:hypothetical protein
MRRVEQRDALAAERQRNPELLADGVVPGRLRDCSKIFRKGAERRDVFGAAEEDEFSPLVEPCEVPQQVPDVGADAEVVQLPRVYTDAHEDMILSGSATYRSQPS